MSRRTAIPDLHDSEPTPEELAQRKRISDRAVLLHHVDQIIRPPAWVHEEMEEAIRHALEGNRETKIESRDGHDYWELEELPRPTRNRRMTPHIATSEASEG